MGWGATGTGSSAAVKCSLQLSENGWYEVLKSFLWAAAPQVLQLLGAMEFFFHLMSSSQSPVGLWGFGVFLVGFLFSFFF